MLQTAALSAPATGMLAFTGYVTSVILMVVQFGSSEFSPRFVARFRRNRTLMYSLSTFSATFLFALVSTAQLGRGEAAFVPTRTLIAALVLTLLSLLMFLILIDRTSNELRAARVVQTVDRVAREVFDTIYPSSRRPALESQSDLLDNAVASAITERQRADALSPIARGSAWPVAERGSAQRRPEGLVSSGRGTLCG